MDWTAEARRMSAKAGGYTRRAEGEARSAAEAYHIARGWQIKLANPIYARFIPTDVMDRNVRNWTGIGDTFLRMSTSSTNMAATYRNLAASYREKA